MSIRSLKTSMKRERERFGGAWDAVLIDTNVFSYLGKAGDERAKLYRPHVEGKLVAVSFVTVGELHFGAAKAGWSPDKILRMQARLRATVIVPYDSGVCEAYGRIKASLPKSRVISDNDLWIAACAVRHSVPLVTHNRRHFDQIAELVVISEHRSDSERPAQPKLDLPGVSGAEP